MLTPKIASFALVLGLFSALFTPTTGITHAVEPVTTDCIIRDFRSAITLNTDSSATIKENIRVDCGNLFGKHGIFRVLPRKDLNRTSGGTYQETPVTLQSITNESNTPIPYEESFSSTNGLPTITWRIGDPGVTITGEYSYVITYSVKNAVTPLASPTPSESHLFYWNLSGNFWQLLIENFQATITFPQGMGNLNTPIAAFEGITGTSATSPTTTWQDDGTLLVNSKAPLYPGSGITIRATLPNIFTPYTPPPTQWWRLFWALFVFGLMYWIWNRQGRDPNMRKTIVPEYTPPQNLKPLEIGLIEDSGSLKPVMVTATIIDLAVRGHLKIEEIESDGVSILGKTFGKKKDWQLSRIDQPRAKDVLAPFERLILDTLFASHTTTKLSEQSEKFYSALPKISASASAPLVEKGLLPKQRIGLWVGLISLLALNTVFIFLAFILITYQSETYPGVIATVLASVIIIVFMIIMPRRTPAGAEIVYQNKGFRLYMKTAEQFRQQFLEKENIFETLLPYAIAFGLTAQWARAAQALYANPDAGARSHSAFMPLWFSGIGGDGIESLDSFASNLSEVTTAMSTSLASSPSSSGSGGGGFSGGGGGGGGGGSW